MVINTITVEHKTEGVYTMNKNQKNNVSYDEVMSCHVPSRPSLFKTLERVKAQVNYEDFGKPLPSGAIYIDPLYKELCLIIAEMLIRPPEAVVRIRGTEMEAGVVQEVYGALGYEHIEHVAARFKEQGHTIYKKTPYLQTALYNVLFEYDASITNELRACGLI
jgi:hypothetical protein